MNHQVRIYHYYMSMVSGGDEWSCPGPGEFILHPGVDMMIYRWMVVSADVRIRQLLILSRDVYHIAGDH